MIINIKKLRKKIQWTLNTKNKKIEINKYTMYLYDSILKYEVNKGHKLESKFFYRNPNLLIRHIYINFWRE